MPSFYNTWLVALSIGVAMLVSYTALRLAARVATSERPSTRLWLVTGALAVLAMTCRSWPYRSSSP